MLRLSRAIESPGHRADALGNVGAELFDLGKVAEAKQVAREALDAARSINHNRTKASALAEVVTASLTSRLAESMNPTVFPVESIARYRYLQLLPTLN